MEQTVRDKYVEAGRIAGEARELALARVEAGAAAADIVEAAETYIREEGAQPAFPVNISVDEVAAHWTPGIGDDTTIPAGTVVNVDVGVHVDGYIGDTAATKDLSGEHGDMVDAAREALDAALDAATAGVPVGDVGAVIQDAVNARGYKPIRNLSGHGLDRYTQHAGLNIPNVAQDGGETLEAGQAVAIEPFATDGRGEVSNGAPGNIYKFEGGNARGRTTRKILGEVEDRFKTLPFTPRWLESVPAPRVPMTVQQLVNGGQLHSYDVLQEQEGSIVTQQEHTVLILEGETVVTTQV